MTIQIPQHASANDRKRTDKYLEPENLELIVEECITQENALQRFKVTVTDKELAQERMLTNNSLSFGDALELLLMKKVSRYKGLVAWDTTKKSTGIAFMNAYYEVDKGISHYYYRVGADAELPDDEEGVLNCPSEVFV